MLTLVQSNDLNSLATRLCEDIRSPIDGFEPETILVQSLGVGQWLKRGIAERLGIAANLNLKLPAHFLWDLYQSQTADNFSEPLDRDALAVRTFKVLDTIESPIIRDYLANAPKSQSTQYSLAQQIGSVFENYLLYRPEWILAWQNGEQPVDHADADWQAKLWRTLAERDPLLAGNHRAILHQRLLQSLINHSHDDPLPSRISLFGLSTLAPMQLEVFEAISRLVPVALYFLNPCEQYWGDLLSMREQERQKLDALNQGVDPDLLYLDAGHPLLTAWGRLGQEFHERLTLGGSDATIEMFDRPTADTTLSWLKRSLVDAIPQLESPSDTHRNVDDSVQLNICHSRLRECEVLLDALYQRIERDPNTLDQTIVLAPNIDDYVPHIEAVFGDKLPFTIVDQASTAHSSIIPIFLQLLRLPSSRLALSEVLAVLHNPSVQRRFNLAPADVTLIERWLEESSVQFEWDGQSKASLWNLPATDQFTWSFGLDRMIAGYLSGAEGELISDCAAINIPSHETETFEKLLGFVEGIKRIRAQFSVPASTSEWVDRLYRLLDEWFDIEAPDTLAQQTIHQTIDQWARLLTEAAFDDAIAQDWISAWFKEKLEESRGLMHSQQNGITFAALAPLSGIPFGHVMILGLDHDAFPRIRKRPSFDLLEQTPRRLGDRSMPDDDRYLFLQAVNAAKDSLYLSYLGRDVRDNSRFPPSLVISELTHFLSSYGWALTAVEHPLQPFSDRYRSGELVTYRSDWFNEPLAHHAEADPIQTRATATISGESLIQFAQHSAKYFFDDQLDASLQIYDHIHPESEPFDLDALDRFQVIDRSLEALLDGVELSTLTKLLIKQGMAIEGAWGERQLSNLLSTAQQMTDTLLAQSRKPFPIEYKVDRVTVSMICPNIGKKDHLYARAGRWSIKQTMRPWIAHLLLNAAGQPRQASLIGATASGIETKTLAEMGQRDAHNALASLVSLYQSSSTAPIFFPIESAWSYLRARHKGEAREGALAQARTKWANVAAFEEQTDPYWVRLDGDLDQIPQIAEQLEPFFKPLLDRWDAK